MSDPAKVKEVGRLRTYRSLGVDVAGAFAYLAEDFLGLRVIDISDPKAPREVAHLDTPGEAMRVRVEGRYAYVADGPAGLRLIDISNATDPQDIAAWNTPGYAYDTQIKEGLAFVADGTSGLRIVDISKPAALAEIGFYLPEKGDVRAVDVAGKYAYLASGQLGLIVLNISDPKNPKWVGQFDTPRTTRSVQVVGSHAYIGDTQWVRVIDISNPSSPHEIAAYKTPGHTHEVSIANGIAYVANYDAGLAILALRRNANNIPAP